ncbi:MAG: AraC family transcriptional regulator [Gammaproteobacteria bacterium]
MHPASLQTVQRISTSDIPAAQRLNFWNDVASDTYGPLVVDGDRRTAFNGEIARLPLNGCEFTSARSTPATVRYQRLSRGPCSHAQWINLLLQFGGNSQSELNGRTSDMHPGDFMLFDPSKPYLTRFDQPTHVLILRMPRTQLMERGLDLEPHVGQRIGGNTGAGALLSSFVRSLYPQSDSFDDAWVDPASEVLFTLLELVYRPAQRVIETPTASQRVFERAKDYIERGLCDPTFDALNVAPQIGVSARYVQILFARTGTTPSRYLLRRRLELAAARLKTDHQASISAIAFSVGFNDLSHFSRAFRRQYQKSAGEFRSQP